MRNNKKLICRMFIIALIGLIFISIIFGFKLRIKDGGLYIGNSVLIPYAYTIHKDHVVLETYHGKEEVVTVPKEIWGKPVTIIGYECFYNKDSLEKVVLNENIEKIDIIAFLGCDNLIEVIQGERVKIIEASAFSSCDKLQKVEIGKNLEVIESGAFSRCPNLKKMYPQEGLVYIGKTAFLDSGLEEFGFNKDVEIGERAFRGTNWVQNQPEEFVIYGDGNLVGYNGTEETIIIPKGVKTINGGCFVGTVAEEIYIPNTVENIRAFVFSNCPTNIKVYIPKSVKQLGDVKESYPINNNDADITIVTTQGSYAHKHAEEYDIPYEIVEEW